MLYSLAFWWEIQKKNGEREREKKIEKFSSFDTIKSTTTNGAMASEANAQVVMGIFVCMLMLCYFYFLSLSLFFSSLTLVYSLNCSHRFSPSLSPFSRSLSLKVKTSNNKWTKWTRIVITGMRCFVIVLCARFWISMHSYPFLFRNKIGNIAVFLEHRPSRLEMR